MERRRVGACKLRIESTERAETAWTGKPEGKSFFVALYLAFLLTLTVYQDFPLVNRIGEIGRSPVILLLPWFLLCEIAMLAKYKKVTRATKLQKYLLAFILYLSFVSLAYVLFQFLQGSYSFGSENLLVKAAKVLIYFVLILLYIRHMQLVFSKVKSGKTLYVCFFAVVTLLLAIMIVELIAIPNAFASLHSGSHPYWRVRLLTSESSTTGSVIVVYGAILAYLSRCLNGAAKTLSFAYVAGFFLFYTSVTGSKGFLVVCLLTLIVTMIKFLDFRKKKNFLLLLAGATAAYGFIASFSDSVIGSFSNDIENYTSSYTRMGTILIALATVAHHPFGVGTGAYLTYFDRYMDEAIGMMSRFYYDAMGISQINAGELLRYSDTAKNLGVKSGFFQWVMFGGIISVVFFCLLARNLIVKAKSSSILFPALIFVLLTLLFVALEIKYEIWLLFAFISFYAGRNEIGENTMRRTAK